MRLLYVLVLRYQASSLLYICNGDGQQGCLVDIVAIRYSSSDVLCQFLMRYCTVTYCTMYMLTFLPLAL
jgi:hypothetical protein